MCLPIFVHAVVLPKSLGALTDGSVESPAMHPTPTVGRPPGQRGRKPGRRKTKVTGPWSQKGSALGPQSIQLAKGLEPIKIPKKRGPKPGSKVGMKWFRDGHADSCGYIFLDFTISVIYACSTIHCRWNLDYLFGSKGTKSVHSVVCALSRKISKHVANEFFTAVSTTDRVPFIFIVLGWRQKSQKQISQNQGTKPNYCICIAKYYWWWN